MQNEPGMCSTQGKLCQHNRNQELWYQGMWYQNQEPVVLVTQKPVVLGTQEPVVLGTPGTSGASYPRVYIGNHLLGVFSLSRSVREGS